tara:strand:+ start:280 stop:858 length:579 start_codon:yes stop_codon:yes gene_type:complete
MKTPELKRKLDSFGQEIVNLAKANLSAGGKGGGALEKSIRHEVVETEAGYDVEFYMLEYGAYQDKGVKGAGGTIKTGKNAGSWGGRRYFTTWKGERKDSPFQFGSGKGKKDGIYKGIESFIQRKGIRAVNKNSLKFAMVKTIWIKGMHGISFFQSAVGQGMQDVRQDILEALKVDIDKALSPSIKWEFKITI